VRLQGAYALCTSILCGFACLRLGNSTSSTPLRIRALIRESSIFFVESELAMKVAHVIFGVQGRELIVDRRIHHTRDGQHSVLQDDLDVLFGYARHVGHRRSMSSSSHMSTSGAK